MRPIEIIHLIRQIKWDLYGAFSPESGIASYLIPESEWHKIPALCAWDNRRDTIMRVGFFSMPKNEGLTFFSSKHAKTTYTSQLDIKLYQDAFNGGIESIQPSNRLKSAAVMGAAHKFYHNVSISSNIQFKIPDYMREIPDNIQEALYLRCPKEINDIRDWEHYRSIMLIWSDAVEQNQDFAHIPKELQRLREDHS